jgi:uncharacterized lipoprotein
MKLWQTQSRIVLVAISIIALAGCASLGVTKLDVQSYEGVTTKARQDALFKQVSNVLVDQNFDIKVSNKDAGLVSTEFKKFASEGSNPPFDYYLQIKATIRDTQKGTAVRLTPVVREQNRMNSAAFTDHELSYYIGSPSALAMIGSMKPSGWRARGQTLFVNVATDVAGKLGMTVDQLTQNVTRTNANALTANE